MIRRTRTLLTAAILGLGLAIGAEAWAQDVGVPVTVRVLDEEGNAIPTAVVRHPSEKDRHRVNTTTGAFTASVLYLPDGSELIFEKGMMLELEISAPGYITEKVVYQVRKRKNNVEVQLKKMEMILDEEEIDDPVIQFGRDKPIDGASTDPAN